MVTFLYYTHCGALKLITMIRVGKDEVSFSQPSHEAPFILTMDEEGFVDVDEMLLCLHFNVQHMPLLLIE